MQNYPNESTVKTLGTGNGVSQDFSALFQIVCEGICVQCIDIIGTSKAPSAQIGKLPILRDH